MNRADEIKNIMLVVGLTKQAAGHRYRKYERGLIKKGDLYTKRAMLSKKKHVAVLADGSEINSNELAEKTDIGISGAESRIRKYNNGKIGEKALLTKRWGMKLGSKTDNDKYSGINHGIPKHRLDNLKRIPGPTKYDIMYSGSSHRGNGIVEHCTPVQAVCHQRLTY